MNKKDKYKGMPILVLERGDEVDVRLSDVNIITGTVDSYTKAGELVIKRPNGALSIIGNGFLNVDILINEPEPQS